MGKVCLARPSGPRRTQPTRLRAKRTQRWSGELALTCRARWTCAERSEPDSTPRRTNSNRRAPNELESVGRLADLPETRATPSPEGSEPEPKRKTLPRAGEGWDGVGVERPRDDRP